MERRGKASYLDDEKADSIPVRRSSCDDEQEKDKAHGRRKGSRRNSEAGKEASDKEEGPYHDVSQGRRLLRDTETTKGTRQC